ncbi:MAG: YdgH/BhsA/McbA-like domain containing protein [Scandinavium sp.]|uniref:YdgH/BhsA/McbA-like domain containing protein n=1 Tax=Scandinavium sp. TaxID=2830653 RepID=UPI003F350F42
MKVTSLLAGAVFVFLSGAALAVTPEHINSDRADGLQKVGTVQVSGVPGSPDDAVNALKAKAEQQNARYFRVVALGNSADSSLWRGSAVLYK